MGREGELCDSGDRVVERVVAFDVGGGEAESDVADELVLVEEGLLGWCERPGCVGWVPALEGGLLLWVL